MDFSWLKKLGIYIYVCLSNEPTFSVWLRPLLCCLAFSYSPKNEWQFFSCSAVLFMGSVSVCRAFSRISASMKHLIHSTVVMSLPKTPYPSSTGILLYVLQPLTQRYLLFISLEFLVTWLYRHLDSFKGEGGVKMCSVNCRHKRPFHSIVK